MEKLSNVAAGMSNELQTTGQQSAQLSRTREARSQLQILIEQMTAAFPHQEWDVDTMKIWRLGFEELVRRHGIENLRVALQSFLTRQKWFPYPSEVSEVLDEMATKAKQETAKNLPKLGCEECADTGPGVVGLVWEPKAGMPRGVLVKCKCRIAREKAKRETVA